MRASNSNHRRRAGMTLFELMLALAIVVLIGGIAWPLASQSYTVSRLRNAAEQVQAAWGKARVQAISTGLPHVFRFETEAAEYSIVAWYDETSELESSTPLGGAGALGAPLASNVGGSTGMVGGQTATTNFAGAATTIDRKLPEGMSFAGIERGADSRVLAADVQLNQSGVVATAPPIVFYPDGTASDATLAISNGQGRFITVHLRGLTGIARVGEITTGPATASAMGTGGAGVSP